MSLDQITKMMDEQVKSLRPKIELALQGQKNLFKAKDLSNGYSTIYNFAFGNEPNSQPLYELYQKYNDEFLKESQSELDQNEGTYLLEFVHQWDLYNKYIRHLQHYFNYLDRSYIVISSKPNLKSTSVHQFDRQLFQKCQDNICRKFRMKLKEDRELSDPINLQLLNKIYMIILDLSKLNTEYKKDYFDIFQAQIISESKEYYQLQYNIITNEYSPDKACYELNKLYQAERKRLSTIFDAKQLIHIKLITELNTDIIVKFRELITRNEIVLQKMLIQDQQYDAFRVLLSLVENLQDQFDLIRNSFQVIITKEGENMVICWLQEHTALTVEERKRAELVLVDKIINFQQEYINVINQYWKGNSVLMQRLDQAMESIVQNFSNILEALIYYILIRILRNVNKEQKLPTVQKLVKLFKCYPNKDVFILNYQSSVASRLLSGVTVNLDDEKLIISEIKALCGTSYTEQLDMMINDYEKELPNYQDYVSKVAASIIVKPKILKSEFWVKLENYNDFDFPIIRELKQEFMLYWNTLSQHNINKTFMWQNAASLMTVVFQTDKPYRLQLNIYQMQILNKFQYGNDPVQISTFITEFGFNEKYLESILNILKKYKLINRMDQFVTFNEEYSEKKQQIELPNYITLQGVQQSQINDDRQSAVEAAIVKIMKTRRKQTFREVQQQVKLMLSTFQPSDGFIKICIENLINKHYLQRENIQDLVYIS